MTQILKRSVTEKSILRVMGPDWTLREKICNEYWSVITRQYVQNNSRLHQEFFRRSRYPNSFTSVADHAHYKSVLLFFIISLLKMNVTDAIFSHINHNHLLFFSTSSFNDISNASPRNFPWYSIWWRTSSYTFLQYFFHIIMFIIFSWISYKDT